jgi:hypothetical protein
MKGRITIRKAPPDVPPTPWTKHPGQNTLDKTHWTKRTPWHLELLGRRCVFIDTEVESVALEGGQILENHHLLPGTDFQRHRADHRLLVD